MNFGVCYYPEHWPEERWATDAHMMHDAGIQYVRIGEFAWAKIEPAEGLFDWDWLDRAVQTLAEAGLKVVMGTPTPAPPAWLIKKHSDILPVDRQGRRRRFGSRQHVCHSNPAYIEHSRRIVQAAAERYSGHSGVAGWQIDNEFGCHDTARCYCECCAEGFRGWLQARYGSLEALNEAWGAVFWSQTYDDWSEINPPNLTQADPNPSHVLDYYRFSSDKILAYAQMQVDILRAAQPQGGGQFITHNLMAEHVDIDYHKLAGKLDFVAWDSYPTGYQEQVAPKLYFLDEKPLPSAYDVGDPYITGFDHDLLRSLKGKPFWIMEQQPGGINWGSYNPGVRPGAVRLWTWHALASGAETVSYFRWRACLYAQEQYHTGLLHHDGSPDQGYRELMAMANEREQMRRIAAEAHQAEVALVFDYEDLWALEIQPHRKDFSYLREVFIYYRALMHMGLAVDLVSPQADLSGYRQVLAPTLPRADAELAGRLEAYVRSGGRLVVGVRSGFKTRSNRVTDAPLPGALRDLLGVGVSDWHSLPPGEGYMIAHDIPNLYGEACMWAEALSADSAVGGEKAAQPLVFYTEAPFAGKAALMAREVGRGVAYTLGWLPTRAQAEAILRFICSKIDHLPVDHVPEGVILKRRGPFTIALNFGPDPIQVQIKERRTAVPARGVLVSE